MKLILGIVLLLLPLVAIMVLVGINSGWLPVITTCAIVAAVGSCLGGIFLISDELAKRGLF